MTIDSGTPKPTIAEIVMDQRAKLNMPSAIVPAVRAHYPDMTPEQITAAIHAAIVWWDAQVAEFGFWNDLAAAVALDPDWYVTEDHRICCRSGALYDTPQKLVAAYRAWHDPTLPVADLSKAIMQRALAVHAKPGDAESITDAAMRIIDAHPRRSELLTFVAEQARRAGKRGKANRG